MTNEERYRPSDEEMKLGEEMAETAIDEHLDREEKGLQEKMKQILVDVLDASDDQITHYNQGGHADQEGRYGGWIVSNNINATVSGHGVSISWDYNPESKDSGCFVSIDDINLGNANKDKELQDFVEKFSKKMTSLDRSLFNKTGDRLAK